MSMINFKIVLPLLITLLSYLPIHSMEPWEYAETTNFKILIKPVLGNSLSNGDWFQKKEVEVYDKETGGLIFRDNRDGADLTPLIVNGVSSWGNEIALGDVHFLIFATETRFLWRENQYVVKIGKTLSGFKLISANVEWNYYEVLIVGKDRYAFCSGSKETKKGPQPLVGTIVFLGKSNGSQADIDLSNAKGGKIFEFLGDSNEDPAYAALQGEILKALERIVQESDELGAGPTLRH